MSRAIRAIVVDDHQILREGVRMLLGQGNETPAIEVVGEAADGAEALALLESTKPDVVVLDLALPGILGIEVCRRAHASGVRVVSLTMHVSGEHVRRAREAGADGYVVKGSGVSELAQAIRIVVAGGEGPFPALPPDPISKLTSREREVFVEVAQGHSNREIAVHLGISVHTVNTHRIHVMEKLEVHDAVALTRLAVGAGLLP
jgi:NarL family two-component system response regulator LiaR